MADPVTKARKDLRERIKAAGGDPRRDLWAWTEGNNWYQVAVPCLGLDAWLYADSAAQAKNKAALQWSEESLPK